MKTTAAAATVMCSLTLALSACSFSSGTKRADAGAASETTSPVASGTTTSTSSQVPTSTSSTPTQESTPSSSSSSIPPLPGGMPTLLKDGDMFKKGEVSNATRAVEQQTCDGETHFYVKDHYLYTCDEEEGNPNHFHFHLVRPCADLMAEDKKQVGAGATQQTWKINGKISQLFSDLPDRRLRYLVTLVQTTNDGKTVARGSVELPYTHKNGDTVNLSVPMWATDRARQSGPKDSPMTVCFAS